MEVQLHGSTHMLESKSKSGELHKDLVSKTTWESHAEFEKYKLSTFRSPLQDEDELWDCDCSTRTYVNK